MNEPLSRVSRILILFLAGLAWSNASMFAATASRTMIDLDEGWRFSRGDFAAAMMPAFDDEAWQA